MQIKIIRNLYSSKNIIKPEGYLCSWHFQTPEHINNSVFSFNSYATGLAGVQGRNRPFTKTGKRNFYVFQKILVYI